MRLAAALAALALLPAAATAAGPPRASLPDIEDEVMCVQCGTALNISEAASADRQREFIRRRIAEGRTKEQIKDALVAAYGPNVLATPEGDGWSAAVYVVPPLLAMLGLAGVVLGVRRWRRITPAPAEETRPLDPADAKRLDKDLASYDL